MITRSQGKLQAREPTANPRGRQIELKTPIQPRSLSDSCSSSAGRGEARKKRKSLPANMTKKGKQEEQQEVIKHEWTLDEQKQLWAFAKQLSKMWPRRMEFYEELADKINEKFEKEGYVTLDRNKVKDKFSSYRGRYQKFLNGKSSMDDTLYKEYGDTISSFFSSEAGTSSGSVSVGGSTGTRKKKSTKEQHSRALKHLISHNIQGSILTKYSEILRYADVLDPFFHIEGFEGQIDFLNSCLDAPPGM